jgi:DNA-binding CsgD family transcriptional regulator
MVAASNHRERLRLDSLVRQSGAAELVSSTGSPDDWPALAQQRGPEVIVSDSPEAATEGVPALVLSADPPGLDGSVCGTLPPDATPEEMAAALRAVDAGLLVLHPSQRVRPTALATAGAVASPLSPRESAVLAMLAEGLGNKIIAGKLGISENTVKFHVSSIMEKLAAGSRTEAVARGLRQGLVIV